MPPYDKTYDPYTCVSCAEDPYFHYRMNTANVIIAFRREKSNGTITLFPVEIYSYNSAF